MSKKDRQDYEQFRHRERKRNKEYLEYINERNNGEQSKLERYNNFLLRNYNIGLFEYNEMFSIQSGCCLICGIHQNELKRKLSVDHCHSTGKIRGLLCHLCNIGLGSFKDNISTLESAIKYLKKQEKEIKTILKKNI